MNAITKLKLSTAQSPKPGTQVLDDGSLVISPEMLARFGGGKVDEGRKELRMMLANERDGKVYSGPTVRPPNVRMAGPDDENAVLELLLVDLNENAAHIAPVDSDKVLAHIQTGTRKRGGLVGIIDHDGEPVAVVILIPGQWWWSNGRYWQELVNFVSPLHRNHGYANDLLDFCKWATDEMSKTMGYNWWLLCGVLGAWRVQSKIALYRRKFVQSGSAFVYPAPPMRGN